MNQAVPTTVWPSVTPGIQTDWIEFAATPYDDELTRTIRVNVSFMLSTYHCIFGKGCPSVLIQNVTPVGGCCQLGVHVDDDEFRRVRTYVKQLTPDDADNYDEIQRRWYQRDADYENLRKTTTTHGLCIMSNRPDGPVGASGKVGCALHHLALRLDVDPSETKPNICWQIPISWVENKDDHGNTVAVLTATTGAHWGDASLNEPEGIGWWCVETPDAYIPDTEDQADTTRNMVFRSHETVLRKLMGDQSYEELAVRMRECVDEQYIRPMPGAAANGGRRMIPLMVANRLHVWKKAGNTNAIETSDQDFLASMGLGEDQQKR